MSEITEHVSSTHKCEVVPVVLLPHSNADSLSIVPVWGYDCVVRTSDWIGVDKAVWLPPDSVVPDTEQFKFLDGKRRIKAKKLRGVVSFGMLVPAPEGSKIGDDVAEQLGITHYEPEIHVFTGGEVGKQPPRFVGSKYDVDSLRRYKHLIAPGELVFISEKAHGSSSRYTYRDGEMYCGSRTEWKKEDPKNLWWRVLKATYPLQVFCMDNPGLVVYGEAVGVQKNFHYGCKSGEVGFAAFDLAKEDGSWFDALEGRKILLDAGVPCVPELASNFPFDFDAVCAMAEGQSMFPGANHIREGCVVKPMQERWDRHIGRVCLKAVGASYLEKS